MLERLSEFTKGVIAGTVCTIIGAVIYINLIADPLTKAFLKWRYGV